MEVRGLKQRFKIQGGDVEQKPKGLQAVRYHERAIPTRKPFRGTEGGPACNDRKFRRQGRPPCGEPWVLRKKETHSCQCLGRLALRRDGVPETVTKSKDHPNDLSHLQFRERLPLWFRQGWNKPNGP